MTARLRLFLTRGIFIRFTGWVMRRGATPEDISRLLASSHPHRDSAWRMDFLNDAVAWRDRHKVTIR